MPGPLFDPELATSVSEIVSYSVAAAGVSLAGIALALSRQKAAAVERLRKSEERNLLDPKTGLLHKTAFQEEFAKRTGNTDRAADMGRRHGLLFADIDDFKALNERITHEVTDERALIPVANILKHAVRPDSDLPARFGGEEFAVLLGDTDEEGTLTVAKNIQAQVNAIHPDPKSPGTPLGLTVAYTTFAQGTPLRELMIHLGGELNEAKQAPGKNQIVALHGSAV